MSRNAAELFDAKGIRFGIDSPELEKEIKLSLEQRRDLYLIYKEAVNNILKYANSSRVDIKIGLENNVFSFLIKDDGVGFDTHKISDRNGIKNMRARAIKLGGTLHVQSEINNGTQVSLSFRL